MYRKIIKKTVLIPEYLQSKDGILASLKSMRVLLLILMELGLHTTGQTGHDRWTKQGLERQEDEVTK